MENTILSRAKEKFLSQEKVKMLDRNILFMVNITHRNLYKKFLSQEKVKVENE